VAPDLPFDRPGVTVAECVEVIRLAARDTAAGAAGEEAADRPVVVAHSLGGVVLPRAAAALCARRMIFLCAVVPREGTSVAAQAAEEGFIRFPYDRAKFDEHHRVLVPEPVAREYFYHDCPPEITAEAIRHLQPQAADPMTEILPTGGWPDVPDAHIVCRGDRLVDPAWGRSEAARRTGRPPMELPGSHSPMLSRPDALAGALVALGDQ
jgi:pimeloyl-ACP methyl ester carboxylesterase